MKTLYLCIGLILFALAGFSQDLIYFADGNILKTTVINQSNDSLNFKLYDSNTKEVFSANKNELLKMINAKGEIVFFPGKKISRESNQGFSKNIVMVNTLVFPAGRITMKYQFLNEKGNLGFEIPVSVGLLNNSYTDPLPEIFNIELYSLFFTGFTLNVYPLGQRKVSYVMGPSFRIGIGSNNNYYYYNDGYYGDSKRQEYYSKLLINNGLVLNPSDHFTMSFVFSLGIMHRNTPPGEYKFGTTADFAVNLGFKF